MPTRRRKAKLQTFATTLRRTCLYVVQSTDGVRVSVFEYIFSAFFTTAHRFPSFYPINPPINQAIKSIMDGVSLGRSRKVEAVPVLASFRTRQKRHLQKHDAGRGACCKASRTVPRQGRGAACLACAHHLVNKEHTLPPALREGGDGRALYASQTRKKVNNDKKHAQHKNTDHVCVQMPSVLVSFVRQA